MMKKHSLKQKKTKCNYEHETFRKVEVT